MQNRDREYVQNTIKFSPLEVRSYVPHSSGLDFFYHRLVLPSLELRTNEMCKATFTQQNILRFFYVDAFVSSLNLLIIKQYSFE